MKKKRLNFKEQFLLGYATGSISFLFISFFLGDIIDMLAMQAIHIMLLCVTFVNAYIWSRYYWIGMPKKEVWVIRGITGAIGLGIFWIVFFIRALILKGFEITLNTFPKTMLLSAGVIVIGKCVWYFITDYLERLALKQINAKLSENRPE